jgi:hypothetical protein
MWLLIECNDIMGVGINETQRIKINDALFEIRENMVGEVIFTGRGTKNHP